MQRLIEDTAPWILILRVLSRSASIIITFHTIQQHLKSRMPRSGTTVDTRTVLKTYNISSTNPKKWQDTSLERPKPKASRHENRYSVLQDRRLDFDEDSARQTDIVEDEEDPLGILDGGVFNVLRKKSIPIDNSPALAQPYLLASRTFSPSDFLATVHSSSTYPTLTSGLENLKEGIQQESGALKQLVTGDFDRFVRCKNGIDELYDRMVERGFNTKEEFGTIKIKKTLDGMLFCDNTNGRITGKSARVV